MIMEGIAGSVPCIDAAGQDSVDGAFLKLHSDFVEPQWNKFVNEILGDDCIEC